VFLVSHLVIAHAMVKQHLGGKNQSFDRTDLLRQWAEVAVALDRAHGTIQGGEAILPSGRPPSATTTVWSTT